MLDRIRNYFAQSPDAREKGSEVGHYNRRQMIRKIGAFAIVSSAVALSSGTAYFLLKNKDGEPPEQPEASTVDLETHFSELFRRLIKVEFDNTFTLDERKEISNNSNIALDFMSRYFDEAGTAPWNPHTNTIIYQKVPGEFPAARSEYSANKDKYLMFFSQPSIQSPSTHLNQIVPLLEYPNLQASSTAISDAFSTIVELAYEEEYGQDQILKNFGHRPWRDRVNRRGGAVLIPNQPYDIVTTHYGEWFFKYSGSEFLGLLEAINMEAALEMEKAYKGDLDGLIVDYLRYLASPAYFTPQLAKSFQRLSDRRFLSLEEKLPRETEELIFINAANFDLTEDPIIVIYRMAITPRGEFGELPTRVRVSADTKSGGRWEVNGHFKHSSNPKSPFDLATVIGNSGTTFNNLTIETDNQPLILIPKLR